MKPRKIFICPDPQSIPADDFLFGEDRDGQTIPVDPKNLGIPESLIEEVRAWRKECITFPNDMAKLFARGNKIGQKVCSILGDGFEVLFCISDRCNHVIGRLDPHLEM